MAQRDRILREVTRGRAEVARLIDASWRDAMWGIEEEPSGWLHKVPLPSPKWRRRLFLPRRNVYVSLRAGLGRGSIAQQIMKLAAAAAAGRSVVLHADSDGAFIRMLKASDLVVQGLTRLYRQPGVSDTRMHRPWHRAASELLSIPKADYHGADYIDNLVVWRQDVVQVLIAHITEQTNVAWEASHY